MNPNLPPGETFAPVPCQRQETAGRDTLEEKVQFQQEFIELLLEASGDCILVVDAEGRVLSSNQAARTSMQLSPEQPLVGTHWVRLFSGLDPRKVMSLERIPRGRSTFQASSRTASGSLKFWNIIFTALDRKAASPERFLLAARDVSEHMLAERALRQSEEAFDKLFRENPIGILLADLEGALLEVNGALCAMLGYSSQELAGHPLQDLHYSEEPAHREALRRLIRGEIRSYQMEAVLQTKSGQPVWAHLTAALLRNGENVPFRICQMVENIQDRKSSDEQLLAYQAQLQSLASALSLGEERERRRIATELHDRIGQSLALARLKLASLAQAERSVPLIEVQDLIEQAIADTRSLTFELSPPVLYELGLSAALEWLTRRLQQEHGVAARFHDDGQPKPLDDDFRVVLFQAARELLMNVVKHAAASHVHVTLRRDADALRISIEDDGVGFDLSKVRAKREAARSFGLFNIRERVEYLGGQVKIYSEPRRGTRVTLLAPLRLENRER